jgi:hypothetical protein
MFLNWCFWTPNFDTKQGIEPTIIKWHKDFLMYVSALRK